MYKSCSRCGRIHDTKYKCDINKPKFDYTRYGSQAERKMRNSAAWANKSKEIRAAAQYLCEVCRDKGEFTYDHLEVHHIIKLRNDKDGLLDNTNLICLCQKHHKQADKGRLEVSYLKNLALKREQRA